MSNKVFVVTGASRGVGKAILNWIKARCSEFLVIGTSRKGVNPAEFFSKARYRHGDLCSLDVTNDESVRAFFKSLKDTLGRIDVLVNNVF
jgi:NAD(P)-dependent dehydrogenase (short-subunit alcohol dehydrogenase family)